MCSIKNAESCEGNTADQAYRPDGIFEIIQFIYKKYLKINFKKFSDTFIIKKKQKVWKIHFCIKVSNKKRLYFLNEIWYIKKKHL